MNIKNLHHVKTWLSMLFILLAVFLFGIYAYSTFFGKPYLSYTNLPFPAPKQVELGQTVVLEVSRCSTSKVTEKYRTTHSIRNQVTLVSSTSLPSVDVSVDPGCTTVYNKINQIPVEIFPGYWRFEGSAEIKGLMRTHQVKWYSDVFEVVPKGELTNLQKAEK